MRRFAAYFSLFFSFFVCSSLTLASVDEGISWLSAQQQSDGGVYSQQDLAIDQQATSEALLLGKENTSLAITSEAAREFIREKIDGIEFPQTEFLARALTAGVVEEEICSHFSNNPKMMMVVLETSRAFRVRHTIPHLLWVHCL